VSGARRFLQRLLCLLRPGAADLELSREVASHLDLLADDFRRRGMTPEEARLEARRAFGGIDQAKEAQRDARSFRWLDDAARDTRHSLRSLQRQPVFAATVVGAMALGIAANGVIFSMVEAVLLRGLPFRDLDRLVMIWQQDLRHDRDRITLSAGDYEAYQRHTRSFEQIAAVRPTSVTAQLDGAPVAFDGAHVSVNLLSTLRVSPVLGRDLTEADRNARSGRVALLSHGAWLRHFGGRSDVLGKVLTLEESSPSAPAPAPAAGPAGYTVVGVLPPEFRVFYTPADIWTPMLPVTAGSPAGQRGLRLIARLKPGVAFDRASEDINALDRSLSADARDPSRGTTVVLIPLRKEDVGDVRSSLFALLAGSFLVLLVVCANVSNMLLSKALDRDRELAVRVALGCGTSRLVRQLLTEALVLGALGAAVGSVLAAWATRAVAQIGPASIPRLSQMNVDWHVVTVMCGLSVLAGTGCGVAPAWRASSRDPVGGLTPRGSVGGAATRVRGLLVSCQVAIAVAALAGAGVVAKSFFELRDAPLGFEPRGILTFRLTAPPARYGTSELRLAFYRAALEKVRAIPGVEFGGVVNILPITDSDLSVNYAPEGQPLDPERPRVAKLRIASPGYVRALSLPIVAGRDLEETDAGTGGVLVSESLARLVASSRADALGRRLRLSAAQIREATIVGVVGDVRQFRDTPPRPTLYYANYGVPTVSFALRTTVDPSAIVKLVRGALSDADPTVAAYDVRTMDDKVENATQFTQGRFRAAIAAAFGLTGLVLSALGVFGVLQYMVTQRTAEIGLRLAIGAGPSRILGMILRQGLGQVAAGSVVGVVLAVAATRVLASFLYGVAPNEPYVLVTAVASLLIVAAAAAIVPAVRAARIEPLRALRHE